MKRIQKTAKIKEKAIRNTHGLSTTEIMCISFIVVVAVVLIITGVLWYRDQQFMADDKLLANTAESVGTINSTGGDCPVESCGGGECQHKAGDTYVGYFDHPTNKIYGEKRQGYNEYKVMEIGGRKYYGEPGTMVIKVEKMDGEISLSWVKGDNR